MIRRVIASALLVAVAVAVTGCGGENSRPAQELTPDQKASIEAGMEKYKKK